MTQTADTFASEHGRTRRARDGRYSRVAIILHWAIAAMIIYNLASGFIVWDFAADFFHAPSNRPFYGIALISHMSSGITVLALTVVRIAWRLTHEPPPHPEDMKPWEKHASHIAHFLLYAAMVLMPLTGWSILSANPPTGSAGAEARAAAMPPPPPMPGASSAGSRGGPPPGGPPPPPRIWWTIPMPHITPLANIGSEPAGLEAQKILHDEIVEWHGIGGWLTLFLLLIHVAGALKHQWLDRHPELERMGIGRRRAAAEEPAP